MSGRILVYGATGYTGRLIAAEAARRGLDVVLAGRDGSRLKAVAESAGRLAPGEAGAHGTNGANDANGANGAAANDATAGEAPAPTGSPLPHRAVGLDDATRLAGALEDVDAVLHVAGPFARTARPMVEACLATGTAYLDITGELDVFEAIARRDAEARAAGVTLLPGVGFDVVPSDCLAVHVAGRIESPDVLRIAIAGMGGAVSRGTALSVLDGLEAGLRVRREGVLVSLPPGRLERHFDLGAGPARAVGMPMGDVVTAFHSTGIPNVETYLVASGRVPGLVRASRYLVPLLRVGWLRRAIEGRIAAGPEGPSDEVLRETRCVVVAEVEGEDGARASAVLETPNGYALTATAAVEAARRVAAGEAPAGFQTPATAFGPDFVLALEGCVRRDLA